MKIIDIIHAIENYHPAMPADYDGCDGVKSGEPQVECTGIVCALVPTYEIIKKTAELGCNLLYTHEVSYYMTPDYPTWRGDFENKVYEEKRRFLEEHGIVVYRDHDRTHAHEPDGIFYGVMKYLGWEEYWVKDDTSLPLSFRFDIPETTVGDLNQLLIDKIGLNGLRFIGKREDRISRVAIVGHLYPEAFGETKEENGYYYDYSTEIMRRFESGEIQAIIPGEVIEWNVLSYIRDAVQMGKPMACFNVGHFNFEELGARYAADWVGEITGHSVPIQYVPTGDIWQFE